MMGRIKVRRLWRMHPRTRVKPSGKRYRRGQVKRQTRKIFIRET